MPGPLVVFYSRTGHTRRIAYEIAAALDAEIGEIHEPGNRRGPLGYMRSSVEAVLGVAPHLSPNRLDLRNRPVVVIGTPIWFWNIASPVRSFLLGHRTRMGRVAFFCTCGGSGERKVLRDLRSLCGRAPVATMALTERQCAAGAHDEELAHFLARVQQGTVQPDGAYPTHRPKPT